MNATLETADCYLGLGSNLDDPLQQVLSAVAELTACEDIEVVALSSLYKTQPVGPQNQADYINAVIRIKTRLAPLALLERLQDLENRHGRIRQERWGARTLDIDILLYDDAQIDLPDLQVPHPELANRAFVLYPLIDIAPQALMIPGKGSLEHLLAECPAQGIQRLAA